MSGKLCHYNNQLSNHQISKLLVQFVFKMSAFCLPAIISHCVEW